MKNQTSSNSRRILSRLRHSQGLLRSNVPHTIHSKHQYVAMKIFRASTHIENGRLEMRLNDVVIIENTELYEQELEKGSYVIQWFVEGKVNTSFNITISSPGTAEFQLMRKLDDTGKDFGGFRFSV